MVKWFAGGIILLSILSGCGNGNGNQGQAGPDALSSQVVEPYDGPDLACTQCHATGSALDPVLLNGSGTAGKHLEHVGQAHIPCTRCHADYYWSPTHLNGRLDAGEPGVRIVRFDTVNPDGAWTQDTGPGTGSCASTYCHGAASTPAWYGTETVTCTTCHYGTAAINPLIINGSGTAGKHAKHVGEKGYVCQTCHEGYDGQATHVNGTLDAGNPAVKLVAFDSMNPSGDWAQDTGAETGDCADTYCHGATNGVVTVPNAPAWYGTAPLDCTGCHSPGSFIDPVAINGSGTAGKHATHVVQRDLPCLKCHTGYTARATHVDGTLETGDPALDIVHFDGANPAGSWFNVSGPGTGSCASTNCHDGSTLDWYGTNTWTLPACTFCHSAPLGARRQVLGSAGDFGTDTARVSHHVADATDPTADPSEAQCQVCHAMDHHMGGTVRLRQADTSAAIAYDPATPSTLEPFCLSCHDADGASSSSIGGSAMEPFGDGEVLGAGVHVAADKIAGYWNNTYTVHKDNGVTCVDCHGLNGTVNAHGSAEKGLLTASFALPGLSLNSGSYQYDNYKLCFDCHANYPSVTKEVVLGYKQGGNYDQFSFWTYTPYYTSGIKSLFRDRYIDVNTPADFPAYWEGISPPYNDEVFSFFSHVPLHSLHLKMATWNYRGDTNATGYTTCVTCHNVHGTSGTVRSTYDEFGIVVGTQGVGPDQYKTLTNTTNATMLAYPIYCAYACHTVVPLSYWNTPADE